MKDFNDTLALDNDDRIASGTLTVTDYEALIGAKSGGTITVNSYAELIGAKAATTITITAFASLSGKTVTVAGHVLTEGADFTAGVSNNATATSLASAIDGLAEVAAAAVGAVVTVTAAAFGIAGNAIRLSTDADAGITLAEAHLIGGKEHGTITVGADTLVQGTDFTAETSNNVTATNIAAAIDGLADYAASAVGAIVTIEAAAIGAAYNVELSATWNDLADTAVTLSGSMLTGGLDEGTVTLGATVLTQGADFTAETNNNTTATNIAAALDAIADFGAAAVGAVVTVTADAAGTAGNAAFTSNSSGVTIVAMSGGADYFYSDVFDYAKEKNPSITVSPNVTALSGGGNVVAVVQVSFDKATWEDLYTFTTFSATGLATKTLTRELNYARVKLSVTGTATVDIRMMTSEFGGDEGVSVDKIGGSTLTAITAGADAVSNTRTDLPASVRLSGFNGATWDRIRAGVKTVTAILTGWLNTLPWAIYNAAPTTRTEGQGGPLQADADGNLKVVLGRVPLYENDTIEVADVSIKPTLGTTNKWLVDFSTALEKSRVVSADPAVVRGVYVRVDASYASDDLWIHVGNHASLPGDGAVTLLAAPVKLQHANGTDTVRYVDFGLNGRNASVGLTVWVSTTEFTKTLIGSSVCAFDVEYLA